MANRLAAESDSVGGVSISAGLTPLERAQLLDGRPIICALPPTACWAITVRLKTALHGRTRRWPKCAAGGYRQSSGFAHRSSANLLNWRKAAGRIPKQKRCTRRRLVCSQIPIPIPLRFTARRLSSRASIPAQARTVSHTDRAMFRGRTGMSALRHFRQSRYFHAATAPFLLARQASHRHAMPSPVPV